MTLRCKFKLVSVEKFDDARRVLMEATYDTQPDNLDVDT